MKIVIVIFFILILASLFTALTYFMKDKEQSSTRTLKALTWRISLSVIMFALLMIGFYTGIITPHS